MTECNRTLFICFRKKQDNYLFCFRIFLFFFEKFDSCNLTDYAKIDEASVPRGVKSATQYAVLEFIKETQ